MTSWYKVKVKAEIVNPDGGSNTYKKVSEEYLFDALSFTEAEARAIKELKDYYHTFAVSDIKPTKVHELFLCEGKEFIIKAKINFITSSKRKGKEKKQPAFIYIQADNLKDAEIVLKEGMKGTMADWRPESLSKTKILEVFKYDLSKDLDSPDKNEGKEDASDSDGGE